MKIYIWNKTYVDGKVNEKLMGASEPGCCKQ